MKKAISFLLIGMLMLTGCGANADNTENATEVVEGVDMFEFDLTKVETIEVMLPDETIVVIEEEEQVEKFCKALAKCECKRREESDLEGGYIVNLIIDGEKIEIGFSREHISYDGAQHEVTNPDVFNIVYDMLGIQYK